MERILRFGRSLIPRRIFTSAQPTYHYLLAFCGALLYRFPGKKIKVVGITGTKGKTTTAELVNAVLEAAGQKTALAGTLRFKIGDQEERNLYKMTMPGRFFIQKFLRRAVEADCDWAVLELTSEGAKQFRHKFIDLNALIFLNIAPEHIESHGSFEKYLAAKISLARALEKSAKRPRAIIANADNEHAGRFLAAAVENKLPYSLADGAPYGLREGGSAFTWRGTLVETKLVGTFNISNCIAAATFGAWQNIDPETIKKGLEKIDMIRGRVEFVDVGLPFKTVVDYAHTPDSLKALYEAFPREKKIAVLGNTGGGRDTWKRPEMAKIADEYCDEIILTNEDPYDEDPWDILKQMRAGCSRHEPHVLMDRRRAIATALAKANGFAKAGEKVVVLITGKGTDPYIMGPNGSKESWDDAAVAREELEKLKFEN